MWLGTRAGFALQGHCTDSHQLLVHGSPLLTISLPALFHGLQVLPAEVLHGFTFALAWGGGVAYCAQLSPPGLEATTQGLFQGGFAGRFAGGAGFCVWTGLCG